MDDRQPVYLIAGGRSEDQRRRASLIQIVLEEMGISSPNVAYVGTASSDDKRFFTFMSDAIKQAGASHVNHALLSSKKADVNKAKEILESADIVYISGGDVEEGMRVLEEKQMVDFLVNLYRQGKPFFGVSAGSIMLAKEWVRWQNPDDDSTAELFPCLGLAPVICDTHAEQDDWEELKIALTLEKEGVKGYGIPSGSALKVSNSGNVVAMVGPVAQYVSRHGTAEKFSDILPS